MTGMRLCKGNQITRMIVHLVWRSQPVLWVKIGSVMEKRWDSSQSEGTVCWKMSRWGRSARLNRKVGTW